MVKRATILVALVRRWATTSSKGGGIATTFPTSTRTFVSNAQTASGAAADTSKQLQKARRYSPGVGLIAGMFGSMIGVGGGVLMNPMILSMCNSIPQRVLTGTSLGAVVSTALASGAVFTAHDSVDVGSAALIAASAILTAPIGAKMTRRLDCRQLRKILAYFLFGAAPLVPLKALLAKSSSRGDDTSFKAIKASEETGRRANNDGLVPSVRAFIAESPLAAAQMLAIGSTAGLFSGLLGIGGGTIVTPLLALTTQLDHAVILGTSMTGMILPSMAGMVQHYRMGNVDPRLLAGLVVGTAAGGFLGSNIVVSPDLPRGSLETLFCLGMLFLGGKTLKSIK